MPSEQSIITIPQINGNFFGGYPYIANWEFNDGTTPSSLKVSVVNPQGVYNITSSDLSYSKTVQVQLGNFTFNGYLIAYETDETAQQTILNLEYVDKSVILEMWNVGLRRRHGNDVNGSNGIPQNMILVGKEYNPCDSNLDSTQSFTAQNQGRPDPCDPCPNMPANGYKNSCQGDLLRLKILPVYYTFNELISAMSVIGLTIKTSGQPQLAQAMNNHRAQHVGNLKSVLSTWCAELGLAYYFDPATQILNIIGRGKPIDIPTQTSFEGITNVVGVKYGSTIAKTFSRGFIGYVGTQGELKNYNCVREDAITLNALTMNDLYANGNPSTASPTLDPTAGSTYDKGYVYNPPNPYQPSARTMDSVSAAAFATALAYYPEQLRQAFLWFQYYGIYDDTSAIKWLVPYTTPGTNANVIQSESLSTQSAGGGGTMTEFGNMNVVKIISKATDASNFAILQSTLNADYTQYVYSDDIKNGRTADQALNDPSYYWIIAQFDENLFNKQELRDQTRAKNFLGRYYYRTFDQMAVGGSSNSHDQLSIDAAGASATFHPRGEYIQQLPVFSFGHNPNSNIGMIEKGLNSDEQSNISSIGTPAGAGATKFRSLKSFILVDRGDGAKYSPSESEFQNWSSSFQWFTNIVPSMLTNNGRPPVIQQVFPASISDPTLRLFLVRKVNSQKWIFQVTDGVGNPWEPLTPKVRMRSVEGLSSSDGNTLARENPSDGSTNAQYGLLSPNTVQIQMSAGLVIYPPAQSIIMNPTNDQGFRVFVKSSSQYPKVVPKYQKTAFVNADTNVGKIDYVYKELQSENLDALIGQTECLPTTQQVTNYVSKFAPYMKVTNNTPASKANVKILGVMPLTQYGVPQGMSSVQISIGDNGVFTDYTFEDKIVLPPAEDIIQDEIIRQNRVAPVLGSSLQKMTTQDFIDIQTANTTVSDFNNTPISVKI